MRAWIVGVAMVMMTGGVVWAQPMQCGTRLINPGDSMQAVLDACGQPDNARTWTETIPAGDDDEGIADAIRVPMAEWVYANDPDQFVSKIVFRNGIVQEIHN
jgi:Protein of unknown function (DUF2845)